MIERARARESETCSEPDFTELYYFRSFIQREVEELVLLPQKESRLIMHTMLVGRMFSRMETAHPKLNVPHVVPTLYDCLGTQKVLHVLRQV